MGLNSQISSIIKVDRYMLPCKVAYFFALAKDASFLPFIIPFLVGMGLSTSEAGLISGIRLVGMILGGPFLGYIADKRQNHKQIVILLIGVSLFLIGGQPIVSMAVGVKGKNKCHHAVTNVTSNKTSNVIANDESGNEKYVSTRFIVMLFLNIIGSFFDGSIMSIVDTGVVHRIHAATTTKDFGWNRLFGSFGYATGSFMVGVAIDYFPKANVNCFTAAYCFYVIFSIGLGVCSCFLYLGKNIEHQQPENVYKTVNVKVKKTVLATLKNIEVVAFILTTFFMGVFHSVYVNFLSLRLQEIKATTSLIGLTISVGSLACVPFLMFSSKCIELFGGIWSSIIISCFTFVVRFFGFAYIQNPWIAVPINALNGFGFGLNIVSMILYIKTVSVPQIYTSMLSIMNITYYGVGFITANIVGGFIFNKYQGKVLFSICSGVAAVWTIILVLFRGMQRLMKSTNLKTKSVPLASQ